MAGLVKRRVAFRTVEFASAPKFIVPCSTSLTDPVTLRHVGQASLQLPCAGVGASSSFGSDPWCDFLRASDGGNVGGGSFLESDASGYGAPVSAVADPLVDGGIASVSARLPDGNGFVSSGSVGMRVGARLSVPASC